MTSKRKYFHGESEKKWRDKWSKEGTYEPDIKEAKKPYYNLMMFPYPSAEGMHVGNMYAFTGADVFGRYQRMHGNDVFEPIGLDGFGIHSENFAIKVGKHPKEHAKLSEKNFYRQLKDIGGGFAWSHKLETYDPDYYRWTQWLFVQMFKKGLVYKGKAMVNWCPSCKTVLSDEQAEHGVCERCSNAVHRREMSSWYFKITQYADDLLENIEKIDWPEPIKIAQRQWIGRKEGINITYPIKGIKETITVFTTRPDTNFGATFVVLSPEVAKEMIKIIPSDHKSKVSKYVKDALNKSEQQRQEEQRKKTGVFTGLYAINGLNGVEMPIWVGDFVLKGVGTGVVVGVPGHDKRDFEFAKEFNLPVKRVVVASNGDKSEIKDIKQVQEDEGVMINSEFLDGMDIKKAIVKMKDHLEDKGWGKRVTTYHLRDWLISRQRYWGPPIPMIYCESCEAKGKGENRHMPGWYSVPEKDLPVVLPDIKDFKPKGDGTSPLSNAPEAWKHPKCPSCGKKGNRELDVSDNFLDSSWYFLRYLSLGNGASTYHSKDLPWDNEILKKWFPVDAYIGGAEHAVLHLLYARFVWMFFYKNGFLPRELGDEPFPYLFSHGLVIKDGTKMSKSKGNVVIPDEYIKRFGADTLRTYLMFMGPYDAGGDFRDTGIEGMSRFLNRVWDLFANQNDCVLVEESDSQEVLTKMHQTIKKVTKDMQSFKYNTAISAVMEFINLLRSKSTGNVKRANKGGIRCAEWDESLKALAQLMAPFAPHMMEEVWVEILGEKFSIHNSKWPEFVEELAKEETITIPAQVNGKTRAQLSLSQKDASQEKKVAEAAKSDPRIKKWLKDKKVEKTFFVPNKIINFVIK